MNHKVVEKEGILYIGATSTNQVLYRIGNNIIISDIAAKQFTEFIEKTKSSTPKTLADKIEECFRKKGLNGEATICGRDNKRYEAITINLKTFQTSSKGFGLSLEDMAGCNQYAFISKDGAKTAFEPHINLSVPPPEYDAFFERGRETKREINRKVYGLFYNIVKSRKASDLVKRLAEAYINHEYGPINNLDFGRELSKIEHRYKKVTKVKSPGIIRRTYEKAKEELFDALSTSRSKDMTELMLEVPTTGEIDQREEYLEKIKKAYSVKGYSFRHVNGISILCPTSESSRIIQSMQSELYKLAKVTEFLIRPAILYFIPEILRGQRNPKEIIITPIEVKNVRLASGELWNLENIGAYEAQRKTKGKGVNVAVIDTGVDYRHPDLAQRYQGGFNFVDNSNNPLDGNGHGTHVSGTIAGKKTGVAPEAQLYAVKVLSDQGYGSEHNVNKGIEWCMDNNINVINMSLGSSSSTYLGAELCKKAAKMGILVCAAAGNEGYGRSYPASYEGVISIAAVNRANEHADFSNVCDTLDLSAPGVNIQSTWPGGSYNEISGTSMASPHAAGVCALGASFYRSTDSMEDKIKLTAENLGDDQMYGSGLVRADTLIRSNDRGENNGWIHARRILHNLRKA